MENKEVSIRIQDIFASFLKSIVWIAVVTAFFGALLGAYGVYKARHTTVNDSYATKITLKENEISDKELTIKNLEKANSTIRDVEIPSMESRIENELVRTKEGKEYIENSIFYSIDPMNCGTAKISFSIDVPVPETVTEDVAAYKDNEMRRAADLCTSACPFSDDVIKELLRQHGYPWRKARGSIPVPDSTRGYLRSGTSHHSPEHGRHAAFRISERHRSA